MPTANVNGCKLYYEMIGQGDPPIVFVHGETHGGQLFDAQMEHFSRQHRCLRYDRRGHARSQLTPYGYSLWNQVEDLKCLLDFAGIERAVIVGVAMATPLVGMFALDHPHRVEALVLSSWYEMDGYPILEHRRKSYRMSFGEAHLQMREILLERGREGLEAHLEAIHKEHMLIFPPDKPEVRRKLVQIFAQHLPEKYIQSGEYYTSIPNVRARMGEVKCPILGICGGDDPSPDDPALLTHLPNFKQEWIPGARRFTMMEYPEVFNRIIESFLARVR